MRGIEEKSEERNYPLMSCKREPSPPPPPLPLSLFLKERPPFFLHHSLFSFFLSGTFLPTLGPAELVARPLFCGRGGKVSLSGEAQKSPIRPPLRLHPDAAAGPLSGTFSPSDGLREGGKEMEHGGTPRSYSHSSRLPCQKKNISKPFSATYPDRGHHTSSRRGCIRQKVFRAGWAQRLFRVLCVDGHVPGGLCRQRSTLLSRVGRAGDWLPDQKKEKGGEPRAEGKRVHCSGRECASSA